MRGVSLTTPSFTDKEPEAWKGSLLALPGRTAGQGQTWAPDPAPPTPVNPALCSLVIKKCDAGLCLGKWKSVILLPPTKYQESGKEYTLPEN